jgi:hypothetical protein
MSYRFDITSGGIGSDAIVVFGVGDGTGVSPLGGCLRQESSRL